MKNTILTGMVLFLLSTGASHATGYHYCSGKVLGLVTRATAENTQVSIENMNGGAVIGYGGSAMIPMQNRQVAMLLSAYMAGKVVTLEFEDNSLICSSNHNGIFIRFVGLQ